MSDIKIVGSAPATTRVTRATLQTLTKLWLEQQEDIHYEYARRRQLALPPRRAALELEYGRPLIQYSLNELARSPQDEGKKARAAEAVKWGAHLTFTLAHHTGDPPLYRQDPLNRAARDLQLCVNELNDSSSDLTTQKVEQLAQRIDRALTFERPEVRTNHPLTRLNELPHEGESLLLFPVLEIERRNETTRAVIGMRAMVIPRLASATAAIDVLRSSTEALRNELAETKTALQEHGRRFSNEVRWINHVQRDLTTALGALDDSHATGAVHHFAKTRDTAIAKLLAHSRWSLIGRADSKTRNGRKSEFARAVAERAPELMLADRTSQLHGWNRPYAQGWNIGLLQHAENAARLAIATAVHAQDPQELRQCVSDLRTIAAIRPERPGRERANQQIIAQLTQLVHTEEFSFTEAEKLKNGLLASAPTFDHSRINHPGMLDGFRARTEQKGAIGDFVGAYDNAAQGHIKNRFVPQWERLQNAAFDAATRDEKAHHLLMQMAIFKSGSPIETPLPETFHAFADSLHSQGQNLIPKIRSGEIHSVVVDLGAGFLPAQAYRQWCRHTAAEGGPQIPIIGVHASRALSMSEIFDNVAQHGHKYGQHALVVTDFVSSATTIGKLITGLALAGVEKVTVASLANKLPDEELAQRLNRLTTGLEQQIGHHVSVDLHGGSDNASLVKILGAKLIPGISALRDPDRGAAYALTEMAAQVRGLGNTIWDSVKVSPSTPIVVPEHTRAKDTHNATAARDNRKIAL